MRTATERFDDAIDTVVRHTNRRGGATVSLSDGSLVGTPSYAVAVCPARNRVVPWCAVTADDIREYVGDNLDLLTQPGYAVGTWFDPATGWVELDIAVVVPDRAAALALADVHGQQAIYDLLERVTIYVDSELGVAA